MTFTEFNFDYGVQDSLDAMGFEKPTPVQAQAIPHILDNKDLIACAQTGTGKTAAYLLPILHKLATAERDLINTIVIVPTRELAVQIDQQLEGFSYFTPVSSMPVYGGGDGSSFDRERAALKRGADIVIATPGRLITHLNLGYVDLTGLQHLILDEADRMLDMGFYEDIMKIINLMPKERQTLLFSATMPPRIREMSNKILIDPEQVNIAISKPAEGVLQAAYMAYDHQKVGLVKELIQDKDLTSIIIFASTKSNVKTLVKELQAQKMSAESIHSDLDQKDRERVLLEFRNRKVQILVATDVVSRGIDISNINLVINYDIPQDPEDYIHRVGRTARADTTGVALTFISEKDQYRFQRIEDLIERELIKLPVPPHLGESPAYNPGKKSSNPRRKPSYKRKKK